MLHWTLAAFFAFSQLPLDTIRVGDAVLCAGCKILLTPVAALGPRDSLDPNIPLLSIARLSDRRFLATGLGKDTPIILFQPNGQFERAVGRKGRGPGEFGLANRLQVSSGADSAYVLDPALRRVSVVTLGGRIARSFSTRQVDPSDLVELDGGRFLLAGQSFSKEGAGYSLHILSSNDDLVEPIGDPLIAFDPRLNQSDLERVIARGQDSTVWVGRRNRYLIERRTSSGRLLRVLERETAWFQPWQTSRVPVKTPPNPSITRVAADVRGMLWVFVAVPAANFKPLQYGVAIKGKRVTERALPPFEEVIKNFDTVVEVFDPAKGMLLARQRLPGYVFPVSPFPYVFRLEQDAKDTPLVRVYQVGIGTGPGTP